VAQGQLGHRGQGFITNEVTNYLNLAGVVALAVFAWDLAVSRDRSARRRGLLWTSWAGMLATLGLLAWLHVLLADMMVRQGHRLTDPDLFRPLHRWYLWTSTVQWGCGLVYAGLSLWAWRSEDRVAPTAGESEPGWVVSRREAVAGPHFLKERTER